jgi:hypothetical protein
MDFTFLRHHVVRWHEWDHEATRIKMLEEKLNNDVNRLPRIISFGMVWGITGMLPKSSSRDNARLYGCIITKSLSHALCVWLQWVRDLHRTRIETGDVLNAALAPVASTIPPMCEYEN